MSIAGLSGRMNWIKLCRIIQLGIHNVTVDRVAASGFCYKRMYERFAGPKKVAVKKR